MTLTTTGTPPPMMAARHERIEAIIFDWAGTTVDFGSLAPIRALQQLFARHGLELDTATARGPMGRAKRDHISALLAELADQWQARYSRAPTEEDIDALYAELIPIQLDILEAGVDLIPGIADVVSALNARGVRIGSTTGYNRRMVEPVRRHAEALGYAPAVCINADDVRRGRPSPDMSLRCVEALQAASVACCVKVDDTPVGIEEGLNAGMWTVGVAISGNAVGLSYEDWHGLPADEQERLGEPARQALANAGAHYVIDTAASVMSCIDAIDARMRAA